jgi:hypothetical protein
MYYLLDKVKYADCDEGDLELLDLEVTPSGSVSTKKMDKRMNKRNGKGRPCFVSTEYDYPTISLSFPTKPGTKTLRLHLLMASTFLNYKSGDIIVFRDGDITNYNIENLIVFSREEFRDLTLNG